ncbi:hypothetical protein [Nocardioides sp. NPDC006273]|uniref:hypothetical protein n=1 Tax=Nocardioides sp. NPDC006273 TaxID=3155598 RepID=UPI0033A43B36
MSDFIFDLIIAITITGLIVYIAWVACLFIDARKRFRVTCECGHRERTITLTSAKWAATEHMMKCRGKAVVSPLPPVDIAAGAE